MYKIRLSSEAKRQFKELKIGHKDAVSFVINDLRENPYIGKGLGRNLSGRYSYRIGLYRIVYKIIEKDGLVDILTIGHRSIVYN